MSEETHIGVPKSVLQELQSMGIAEFAPCAMRDISTDTLVIIERDCSMCEETVPGSAITLFRDNYNGEVVGVQISGWSKWSKDF